jgi:sec-independent protein translocase protein TatC
VKKYRKLYYYVFLLFSTLVTPPDLISQIVTTFVLIVLYEIILVLSMLRSFIR